MIEGRGTDMSAQCDYCSNYAENGEGLVLEDFITSIRLEGWNVAKVNGVWTHRCPECKPKLSWGRGRARAS